MSRCVCHRRCVGHADARLDFNFEGLAATNTTWHHLVAIDVPPLVTLIKEWSDVPSHKERGSSRTYALGAARRFATFALEISRNQVDGSGPLHLGRIQFLEGEHPVAYTRVSINEDNHHGDSEIKHISDGGSGVWSTELAYFPSNIARLLFEFPAPVAVSALVFTAAESAPEKDPGAFKLFGIGEETETRSYMSGSVAANVALMASKLMLKRQRTLEALGAGVEDEDGANEDSPQRGRMTFFLDGKQVCVNRQPQLLHYLSLCSFPHLAVGWLTGDAPPLPSPRQIGDVPRLNAAPARVGAIGGLAGEADDQFGLFADLKLFKRALSPAEVTDMYLKLAPASSMSRQPLVLPQLRAAISTLSVVEGPAAELLESLEGWWKLQDSASGSSARCATPGCPYKVNSNAEYASEARQEGWTNYCCATCRTTNGKHHGGRCQHCVAPVAAGGPAPSALASDGDGDSALAEADTAREAEEEAAVMPSHAVYGVSEDLSIVIPSARDEPDLHRIATAVQTGSDAGGLDDSTIKKLADAIGVTDVGLKLPRLKVRARPSLGTRTISPASPRISRTAARNQTRPRLQPTRPAPGMAALRADAALVPLAGLPAHRRLQVRPSMALSHRLLPARPLSVVLSFCRYQGPTDKEVVDSHVTDETCKLFMAALKESHAPIHLLSFK